MSLPCLCTILAYVCMGVCVCMCAYLRAPLVARKHHEPSDIPACMWAEGNDVARNGGSVKISSAPRGRTTLTTAAKRRNWTLRPAGLLISRLPPCASAEEESVLVDAEELFARGWHAFSGSFLAGRLPWRFVALIFFQRFRGD